MVGVKSEREGVGKTSQNQQCGHYVKRYERFLLLRFKMFCYSVLQLFVRFVQFLLIE